MNQIKGSFIFLFLLLFLFACSSSQVVTKPPPFRVAEMTLAKDVEEKKVLVVLNDIIRIQSMISEK